MRQKFSKSEFLADVLGYDPRPCELFTHKTDVIVRRVKRFEVDKKIGESLLALQDAERLERLESMVSLFTANHEANEVSPLSLIGPAKFSTMGS